MLRKILAACATVCAIATAPASAGTITITGGLTVGVANPGMLSYIAPSFVGPTFGEIVYELTLTTEVFTPPFLGRPGETPQPPRTIATFGSLLFFDPLIPSLVPNAEIYFDRTIGSRLTFTIGDQFLSTSDILLLRASGPSSEFGNDDLPFNFNLVLVMEDTDGTAITGIAPPATKDFAEFEIVTFTMSGLTGPDINMSVETYTYTPSVIPLPATGVLMVAGLGALGLAHRRRRRKTA